MTLPRHSARCLPYRKKLGLSQAQLGRLLGVHEQTISKWERGMLEPTNYQQSLLHALMVGHSRAPKADVAAWLKNQGPIETLAYLLAVAYRFLPSAGSTGFVPVDRMSHG